MDNLLSNEGRLRGALLERLDLVADAEIAFRHSVDCAREAVVHTKSHPYSHLGLAKSCLTLSDFLIRQGKSPSDAAREGLAAAECAMALAQGNRSISALRERLAALVPAQ